MYLSDAGEIIFPARIYSGKGSIVSRLNWRSLIAGIALGGLLFASAPVIADIGDPILQGTANVTDTRTTLRGSAPGANLRIVQQSPDDEALALFTEPGVAPMKVNRKKRVKNLNADRLDGRHASYFAPAVPEAGDLLRGAFGGVGGDGQTLVVPVSFAPALPYPIPESKMHYVGVGEPATPECPGNLEAAPGHLCAYANWEHGIAFVSFLTIAGGTTGATENGFAIRMLSSDTVGNFRGTWVHTVGAAPAADAPGDIDREVSAEFGP